MLIYWRVDFSYFILSTKIEISCSFPQRTIEAHPMDLTRGKSVHIPTWGYSKSGIPVAYPAQWGQHDDPQDVLGFYMILQYFTLFYNKKTCLSMSKKLWSSQRGLTSNIIKLLPCGTQLWLWEVLRILF